MYAFIKGCSGGLNLKEHYLWQWLDEFRPFTAWASLMKLTSKQEEGFAPSPGGHIHKDPAGKTPGNNKL